MSVVTSLFTFSPHTDASMLLIVIVCGSVRSMCNACSCNASDCLPRPLNVLALCWKNLMRIYRNPGLLFFQFLLPTIQVALFCLAVGRTLEGVDVAYVNEDKGECTLTQQ